MASKQITEKEYLKKLYQRTYSNPWRRRSLGTTVYYDSSKDYYFEIPQIDYCKANRRPKKWTKVIEQRRMRRIINNPRNFDFDFNHCLYKKGSYNGLNQYRW